MVDRTRLKRAKQHGNNDTGRGRSGMVLPVAYALIFFLLGRKGLSSLNMTKKIMESLSTRELSSGSSATTDATQSTEIQSQYEEYQAANHHTYGLFDKITNNEWQAMRQHTLTTSWYAYPNNILENVTDAATWNKNNMNPNFECPNLVPLGNAGRGETKYVCNPQRLAYETKPSDDNDDGCLIYSFGCAGDFQFEDAIHAMHDKACEIHVFDPAVAWERKGDVENKNIHYHAWGLLSTYDDSKSVVWPKGRGGGFKTFPETMDLLGHQNRTIDILKIDCEGCEWSTAHDWIGLGIRQILVETHGVPTPQGTPEARWYKKPLDLSQYYQKFIDNGYALFHKDPNGELSTELCFIKLHEHFWKVTQ